MDQNNISLADVKLNFAVTYQIVQRNGYCVPKAKSPFTTLKYLGNVVKNIVFAPQLADVRLKACPVLPP